LVQRLTDRVPALPRREAANSGTRLPPPAKSRLDPEARSHRPSLSSPPSSPNRAAHAPRSPPAALRH